MKKEHWGSPLGIILAITNNAIGLGNFFALGTFPLLLVSFGKTRSK